jgi:DNA-directed RNA polymerase specialized sigma24 family protein
MEIEAIRVVRREWERQAFGPRGRQVLLGLRATEPEIASARAHSIGELVDSLDRRASSPLEEPWRITSALIRRQEVDELVSLGVLVALAPGLQRIARELGWGGDGPWASIDELGCDLVTETWAVLNALSGSTVSFPELTVLRTVGRRLRRHAAETRSHQTSDRFAIDEHDHADPSPLSDAEAIALALPHIASPAVPKEDLDVVFANRVLGYSYVEIARATGRPRETLRRRARIVEAELAG